MTAVTIPRQPAGVTPGGHAMHRGYGEPPLGAVRRQAVPMDRPRPPQTAAS
jgi:hypothetical protein